MKKICLLIMMVLMPFVIYAKEYNISEINLKLTIDEDLYVFTKNEFPESDALTSLGITKEYMDNYFAQNRGVYVDAASTDFSYELIVNTATNTTEVYNMKNCSDAFLESVAGEIVKTLQNATSNIYNSGRNKYVVISFYDTQTGYYIYRYYTIVNNMIYHFNIQKHATINENEKALLKRVVDTADFNFLPQYQTEKANIQKEINGNGKNEWWKNVLIDAAIGGLIGGTTGLIISIVNKRKKTKLEKKIEETGE